MFGRKKKPVDFCRAKRLLIAAKYIEYYEMGSTEKANRFLKTGLIEFDGLEIDRYFLNEASGIFGIHQSSRLARNMKCLIVPSIIGEEGGIPYQERLNW